MSEVRDFLEKHLQGIFDYDLALYAATTVPELGLYEWCASRLATRNRADSDT